MNKPFTFKEIAESLQCLGMLELERLNLSIIEEILTRKDKLEDLRK